MEYLSDDEKNEGLGEEGQEELTFEELYPDEEMDEETRNLIFNTVINENDDYLFSMGSKDKKKGKDKNGKEKKEKKVVLLNDLLSKTEEKSKPWISKRTEGKKTNKPLVLEVIKRKFSPRLPPYNTIKREEPKKEQTSLNKDEFPSLT